LNLTLQGRMPSKQKNEGKEILLLDFELFIGGYLFLSFSVFSFGCAQDGVCGKIIRVNMSAGHKKSQIPKKRTWLRRRVMKSNLNAYNTFPAVQ